MDLNPRCVLLFLSLPLTLSSCNTQGQGSHHNYSASTVQVNKIDQFWKDLETYQKEDQLNCNRYTSLIVEMINLAHSTDPQAKMKRTELRRNVTSSATFILCYEKALAMLEKKEMKMQYEGVDQEQYRGGRFFKFFKNVFHGGHGNKNFELNIKKSKDVGVGDGWRRAGPGCWVGQRWDDDYDRRRGGGGGRRPWDDYDYPSYDRDGDFCSCEDELCCDCEPDRGGSCCQDWCDDMCDNTDWDFRVERFCDRPVHSCGQFCLKFEHCCNSYCGYRRRF